MRSRRILVVVALSLVFAGCSGGIVADDHLADDAPVPVTEQQTDTATNGTLTVHTINVGQGDSLLIVGPTNETMLVDSGTWQDDGQHVIEYLESQDVDRIDYLVTSHTDADHIGGHAAVIDHYETERDGVGAVYDPGIAASTATYESYLDAIETHNVTLLETREGDSIPFEGADVRVLGPPEPSLATDERNENSIVMKLTYGETSFLLTGDAGIAQEKYLVETYGPELNATVLKAGHHGSNTSTGNALLTAVNPEASVVSSAYDSQFGHPDEATLDRLANGMIPTYWTGTHGDVVFESDGETVTVKTQRAATSNPLRLRNHSAVDPSATDPVQPREILCDSPHLTAATDEGTQTPTESGAPTVTASQTSTLTATVTPTPTTPTAAPESGSLDVVKIHADAEGDDRENLNDEYVVFRNTGDDLLEMSGWAVSDEADHTYTVPDGFTLDPGSTVTLHTGSGEDTETDLYWGSGQPIWNNGGDTVVVTNANGEEVLRESYE